MNIESIVQSIGGIITKGGWRFSYIQASFIQRCDLTNGREIRQSIGLKVLYNHSQTIVLGFDPLFVLSPM